LVDGERPRIWRRSRSRDLDRWLGDDEDARSLLVEVVVDQLAGV
jgi:hypothetical protein